MRQSTVVEGGGNAPRHPQSQKVRAERSEGESEVNTKHLGQPSPNLAAGRSRPQPRYHYRAEAEGVPPRIEQPHSANQVQITGGLGGPGSGNHVLKAWPAAMRQPAASLLPGYLERFNTYSQEYRLIRRLDTAS
ncbi:hypothetical protein J6590_066092 [Homalodisca vitripennis]|nr:hypothetical protein J6590_066092 [Homalodisca vitripennis]